MLFISLVASSRRLSFFFWYRSEPEAHAHPLEIYGVYFLCYPLLFLYVLLVNFVVLYSSSAIVVAASVAVELLLCLCLCDADKSEARKYAHELRYRFLVLWQWLSSFPYGTIEFIAHQRLLTVNDYRSRFIASHCHFHVYFIIHFRITRSPRPRSFRSSNKLYGFYRYSLAFILSLFFAGAGVCVPNREKAKLNPKN